MARAAGHRYGCASLRAAMLKLPVSCRRGRVARVAYHGVMLCAASNIASDRGW